MTAPGAGQRILDGEIFIEEAPWHAHVCRVLIVFSLWDVYEFARGRRGYRRLANQTAALQALPFERGVPPASACICHELFGQSWLVF